MPLEIRKELEARADLFGIWSYTADQWGEEKADQYLRMLNRVINELSENPRRGTNVGHRLADLRRLTVEHHRIYFFADDEAVHIVRVLHEAMDAPRHLRGR